MALRAPSTPSTRAQSRNATAGLAKCYPQHLPRHRPASRELHWIIELKHPDKNVCHVPYGTRATPFSIIRRLSKRTYLKCPSATKSFNPTNRTSPDEAVVLDNLLNSEASQETTFTYFIKAEPEKAQQADDGGSSDASNEEDDDESVAEEDAVEIEGDEEDSPTSTAKLDTGAALVAAMYEDDIGHVSDTTYNFVRHRQAFVSLIAPYSDLPVINLVKTTEDFSKVDEKEVVDLHETTIRARTAS